MVFLFGILPLLWADPVMEVELPSKALKADETGELVIRVSWKKAEGDFSFPLPQVPLENLALETIGESNETFQKEGEEWKAKIFRIQFKGLKPGKGRIQKFRMHYIDPATQKGGFFDIVAPELRIQSDLSGLYRGIFLAFLGVGLLAGMTGGLIFFRKKAAKMVPDSTEMDRESKYLVELSACREQGKADPTNSAPLGEADRLLRSYLKETQEKLSLKESKNVQRILTEMEELRFGNRVAARGEFERLLDEILRFMEARQVVVKAPSQN